MKKKNKQSGFTLVEILVAVAIFSAFIVLAVAAFVNIVNLQNKTSVLRKTQEDTRYVLEAIVRDARGANGLIDSTGARTKHGYSLDLATHHLTLNTTSNGVPSTTEYSLVNGVLKKLSGGVSYDLNDPNDVKITEFTPNITFTTNCDPNNSLDLAWSSFCPPLLDIKITAESGPGLTSGRLDMKATTTLESSVTPRNY